MLVEAGACYARMIHGSIEERDWLHEYLSFPDAHLAYLQRRYSVDARKRMFNQATGSFPAGFVPLVRRQGAVEGFTVDVVDKRSPPVQRDMCADLGWLRDYQLAAVEAVVKYTRGLLHLPTGAGKTECAVALTRVFPCKWLFLVESVSLMHQAADRYELRTNLPSGRVGDGVFTCTDSSFVCASFGTMRSLIEKRDLRGTAILAHVGGLIVDECHQLPADSFFRTVQAIPAYWRVGLSGTPLARGDRKSSLAVGALGPVIYRVTTEKLVECNVIELPKVSMVLHQHTNVVKVPPQSARAWDVVYKGAVVSNAARNALVIQYASQAKKPCIIFVKNVRHGKALTADLCRAGVPSRFVWGALSTVVRDQVIKELERGVLEVIVASVVFQTGIDIPSLQSAVVAAGGKSAIATIQRVGRGTRKSAGKEGFDVYDFEDRGCGCTSNARAMGLRGTMGTHAACRWLESHTKDRIAAYVSEGYAVTHVTPAAL